MDPIERVKLLGADALRLALIFFAPIEKDLNWENKFQVTMVI